MAADGVDLVDEDDAGRVALGLLEQVAHAGGADTDEHLDELGARDREEGDARLAGDGLGEQRLARAGRADQQHALGNARAQGRELLRVLEEFDDFLQLVLRLFDAGDVQEGDVGAGAAEHARLALAEAHRLVVGALRLTQEEEQDGDDEDDGQELNADVEDVLPGAVFLDVDGRLLRDRDAFILQESRHGDVLFQLGLVLGVAADKLVVQRVAVDVDFCQVP